jgi:uncharacterized membrane protein YgdD (TMEM256/DUF423 family)
MQNSKQLAGLIGPIVIVMTTSEALNEHIWVTNIAPAIYLNGTVLFAAALAILRIHNHWVWDWPVLITLVGWFFLLLGLFRMFAPSFFLQGVQNTTPLMRIVPPIILSTIGVFLTYKGYSRSKNK